MTSKSPQPCLRGSKASLYIIKSEASNKQSLPSAHVAWSTISDIAEIVQPKATNREEFIAESKSGALDGVSVAYRTFDSANVTGRIDSELLDALPKSLKFLCHNGKIQS